MKFLEEKIRSVLQNSDYKISKVTKRQTQNIASFKSFITVNITKKSDDFLLEVSALDHPGLLSKICESMDSCNLMVKDAKISTLGEEANDIFVVIPTDNKIYLDNDIDEIRCNIEQKISELYN